ncbi:MAG: prolyl oligopeptidase family serine peptidase [Thermoanaerobaculia bacterium]
MRSLTALAVALTIAAAAAPTASAQSASLKYPTTKKIEQVDTYAGNVQVSDPYRWLETDVRTSDEVRAWVDEQNKVTFGYLAALPQRGAIKQRLEKVWNYEKYTTPFKEGGRYYFRKNDGLQNQSVLYVQDSLDQKPRVLLDPNGWTKDGTVALGGVVPSKDGRYLAYSVSEAGSDWQMWRVLDLTTGQPTADEIRWVKSSGASWTTDSKGFFYSRFPIPEAGAAFQSLNKNHKIYYHRIGTPQSDDVLVHYDADHPDWNYFGGVTEDGRYLIITASAGTSPRYRVLWKDLTDPYAMPVTLVEKMENNYSFVGNDGPVFYFETDVDAPRGRLIAIDIRNPEKANWKEIIPQATDTLQGVGYVGGHFVASYLHDAQTAVKIYDLTGKHVRDVALGGIGTAGGFNGRQDDTETFYSFTSFTVPPSIYRYDIATGEKKLISQSKVDFDPTKYEVKQVFYKSKDGTKVPMFIAHKKGLKLNGQNPTLLYGYGGFNVSTVPTFSPARVVWMEMGGVYASANLRGGGEYGHEWHQAGTKLQKQNVFDDFIAAGEWLVANKYTSPKKLGIQGGSNGGLLVGAVLNQRPDLFGAALPAVGVMDMLRFQKFTAGRYWVDDYGSSDNPEEFKAIYAYSPYHNLKPGTKYPATLVTTADTDDRVVPGHSFKYAARLQETHVGDAPVLIRIETRAGHGAGKPTAKQIEEVADLYAFLAANLGVKMPKGFGK